MMHSQTKHERTRRDIKTEKGRKQDWDGTLTSNKLKLTTSHIYNSIHIALYFGIN